MSSSKNTKNAKSSKRAVVNPWLRGTKALRADAVIGPLIRRYGSSDRIPTNKPFIILVRAIIGQQISVKAAASVMKKVTDHFGVLTPTKLAAASFDELRALGLSRQKATYLQDLAAKFIDGTVTPRRFARMSDEEIIEELVQVKGIGRWTAEMFLIFCLGREDVWAIDDLGLQIAVEKNFKLRARPTKAKMIEVGSRWSPYRSVASLYLWQSLQNMPMYGKK